MPDVLVFGSLVGLLYGGFLLIAISQERHWRTQVKDRPVRPRSRAMLRVAGGGLLAGGLAYALWWEGTGFGLLLWACTLSPSAFLVAMTLARRPS